MSLQCLMLTIHLYYGAHFKIKNSHKSGLDRSFSSAIILVERMVDNTNHDICISLETFILQNKFRPKKSIWFQPGLQAPCL